MMFLGSSEQIREGIARLIAAHDATEPIAIAVAFWGAGAESMLPLDRHFRVICNLSMGGTNPTTIENLMAREGVEVRHMPDLHAKVVVAASGAVVSSSNFSANGLGLDGSAGDSWQEAGMSVPASDPEFVKVYAWFEHRWRVSNKVDAETIANARRVWESRLNTGSLQITNSLLPDENIAQEELVVELMESDLFEPRLTGQNQLRMGSKLLLKAYAAYRRREPDNLDRFVPAYAAYVLWTLSGRSMETRKLGVFSRPKQVFDRADQMCLEKGRDFALSTRNFLNYLTNFDGVPDAVRYWAQQCVEQKL